MTKKTRLIILLICIVLFFVIIPYILLYSLGYRVDFAKKKIVATGGIYVRVLPQGANVSIDNNASTTTSLFSSAVFVQNLLPGNHSVQIKKAGYYDYQKNLPVTENQVTKIEHVLLFKKNIAFSLADSNISYFSFSPDRQKAVLQKNDALQDVEIFYPVTAQKKLVAAPFVSSLAEVQWSNDSKKVLFDISENYYLLDISLTPLKIAPLPLLSGTAQVVFDMQDSATFTFVKNKNLFESNKTIALEKNVAAYKITGTTITWLSYDGYLYNATIENPLPNKISLQTFTVNKNSTYKLSLLAGITFLQENDSLFWLNPASQNIENFYDPAQTIKLSPDGQKLLYFNSHEIILSLAGATGQKTLLNRYSQNINDCYWLNSDYLIFSLDNSIIISEIDSRDNINTITLPQSITLATGQHVDVATPQIYFNQTDGKLYLLTGNTLLSSERLVP